MNRMTAMSLVLAAVMVVAGCATTSRVHFEEPAGAVLYLRPSSSDDKGYTFPVALDLQQTDNPLTINVHEGGRPILVTLPDGTKLKGYLYVYELAMNQLERLAMVSFRLTEEQIGKLRTGSAVTVTGYSAGSRPVYRINLGLDR